MRITILAYGTRGDVQPLLALGLGLQRAGHTVQMAAPTVFEGLVTDHSLDFHPLPGDIAELSRRLVDEAQRNIFKVAPVLMQYAIPLAGQMIGAVRDACRKADAIIHTFLVTTAGHVAAREYDIPDFFANMFPIFAASSRVPAPISPGFSLGGWYNRLTHYLFEQSFWQFNRLGYRLVHRHLPADAPRRLFWPFHPPDGRPITPILFGISPHVYPPQPDWGSHVHVTGYWFLDSSRSYTPPGDLARFLEAGPPPVYIGFGSTVTVDVRRLTRITKEAIRRSGRRAVLLRGWSGMGAEEGEFDAEQVYVLDSAPHDWLFPRMAAVMHHGGAGTTAAGLRAGIPSIITPFTSDQPFWAHTVYRLGVGPKPISAQKLTAESLAGLIHSAVTDQAMRDRAARLGEAICTEDGVGQAVGIIERYLRTQDPPV